MTIDISGGRWCGGLKPFVATQLYDLSLIVKWFDYNLNNWWLHECLIIRLSFVNCFFGYSDEILICISFVCGHNLCVEVFVFLKFFPVFLLKKELVSTCFKDLSYLQKT